MCERDGAQLVLDPFGVLAEPVLAAGSGSRADGELRGKRVGIIDNLLAGMRALADALEIELVEAYGVSELRRWTIPQSTTTPPATIEAITHEVDVAVLGLGNCGACTTWTCALSARLREVIPTLDVVTQPFELLARTAFRGHGLPEQPLVTLRAGAETADAAELTRFARLVGRACASELTTAGA